MSRHALAGLVIGALLCAAASMSAHAAEDKKILKVAFRNAETSFDPAAISDSYSRTVTPHIFEGLYKYDHLARPPKIKPLLADGMPEGSADFKTWAVKVRRGIYFADDPAFKGAKREVTAQDFIYGLQRIADPANKSPLWGWIEAEGFVGLAERRQQAIDGKRAFDYDAPIEGLRAQGRYTIVYKVAKPRPRLVETIANSDLLGAQAREVVEFYGDKIGEHPVGTGPFRLKQWRRSSLIVLEKSPDYRGELYDAEPAADDADGQALLARLKGRKLPMIDEVRISIIDESQPLWLSFLNEQIDIAGGATGSVPGEFISQAMPGGKVAAHLAKRGIQARRNVNPDAVFAYFNMEDPVVGGYTPDKVALRRAIGLAYDVNAEITRVRRGQAIPAQSIIAPNTTGYEPTWKSENSEFSPARAKALLDVYGYVDRNGDGWRDLPDGQPLVLTLATQPDQFSRDLDTLWKNSMAAIGVRVNFAKGQWTEQLKQARAGKLQMWSLANLAASLDGQEAFQRLHGPQSGSQNYARFKLAAFDALYDRMSALPDGPERLALFDQAKRLSVAYAPYKVFVHRLSTDMWHPWVIGFRRPLFWNEWWHMVDIDPSKKPAH
jgi:ABC-type transport system substrate-binding protein